MTRTVGILLYDQVEILDFAGPLEVFSTASRVFARNQPQTPPPFTPCTIRATANPVKARGGLTILCEYSLQTAPALDVLLVPGGVVTDALSNKQLLGWLAQRAATAELTASVCTGAFLLAAAGLLENRPATTHWEDLDDLTHMFPQVRVCPNRRWVESDRTICSAGISAGIDMSLHLVARLVDLELAWLTAKQMEYIWNREP